MAYGKTYKNLIVFAFSFVFLVDALDGYPYDDLQDVLLLLQVGLNKSVVHNDPIIAERLDGGGKPWALFQAGHAPGYKADPTLEEAFLPEDGKDPIVMRCAPGSQAGYLYYNVSDPDLVPFIVKPDQPNRVDTAIIVAPGGGCDLVAWNKEGTHAAKWLNSIGVSAFVLKYRVPCGFGQTLNLIDSQRAVSLVRHNAGTFGFNASRIGFMGFSAGANVAARVSYTQDRLYEHIDEADSASHLPDFAMLIYGNGDPREADSAPPTFMAIAVNDQCIDAIGAELYYRALQANGLHHELHIYSDGHHGYGDCTMYVQGGEWKNSCLWTANAKLFLESRVLGIHRPVVNHTTHAFYTKQLGQ